MTFNEAQTILSGIMYKPKWILCLLKNRADVWHLWASFETQDCVEPSKLISLESRVWLIDPSFTERDVVETAFLCIRQAEEHEMAEWFKYDKFALFTPHLKISARKDAVRASFGPRTLARMGVQ